MIYNLFVSPHLIDSIIDNFMNYQMNPRSNHEESDKTIPVSYDLNDQKVTSE